MKKLYAILSTICAFLACMGIACASKKPVDSSSSEAPSTETQAHFKYNYLNNELLKGYELVWVSGECGENGVFTFPDTYMGESVVSIGLSAPPYSESFYNAHPSVTKVVIPASVRNIRREAFYGMKNLREVEFAKGSQLETIRSGAFKNCSSLTTINLPEGTRKIEPFTFENCTSLTTLSLPSTIEVIDATSFIGCAALQEIRAASETFAGIDGVLYNKKTMELVAYPLGKKDKSYQVEETSEEIAPYAFYENPWIESVTMENVLMMRQYAFFGCTNLSVITAENLGFVDKYSLSGTAWWEDRKEEIKVTLGNAFIKYRGTEESITINGMSIAPYAFKGNTTLKEVTLCVRTVMEEAFMDCTSLERVYIHRNAPTDIVYIGQRVFDNNAQGRKIIIPHESLLAKYNAKDLWQPYIDSIEVAVETNE